MANAKWNSYPTLAALELNDADLLPVSDDSEPSGSKDKTVTVGALRTAVGPGVPVGGTTGQVLAKASNADRDTEWVNQTGGGGDPLSINAQTGTTYTLVLDDAGKLVTLTNSSAITLTVPTNASVAYPVGTVIALAQLDAGLVTVEGDTGVTINGVTPGDEDLAGQWATAALTKLATDTWLLSGGIA